MPLATVITADIVQSSKLTKKQFNALIKAFQSLMQPHAHEFYRGDSFQIYLPQNEQAIRLALALRLAVKKMDLDIKADLRIAIGIGSIKSAVPDLRISTEAPFVLSGRALDKLSSQSQYFAIECERKNAEQSFRLIARFIDYLFKNITSKQAAVLYELVLGQTQTNTAKKLKKSQATINKQAHAAGWSELEQLVSEYHLTLAQL